MKSLKSKKFHEINAGPVSRLSALLIDLSLSYGLFYYLNSYIEFRDFISEFSGIIQSYLGLLNKNLTEVFPILIVVYLLGQFIRFYGTLILGVSFGQLLMGIRGTSPFIWNRIGGGGRVFIETFSGALLLLDLPLFSGNISIKERLSMTRLIRVKGLISQKLRFFFVPLFLGLSFFAPMLQNLTLIDGITVSFTKEKSEKLSNQTNFDSYKYYPSNRFKMNSFSSLKNGRFLLLPSFQITKKGKSKKITPYFIIYDTKNNADGYFKITGTVPLLDVMLVGIKGNPLFKSKYPELFKILNEQRSIYEKRPYQEKYNKRTLINKLAGEQIEDLIQTSFELSYSSVAKHFFSNGPFIRGYVEVRNRLLGIVNKAATPEIDIIQMGAHKFLRFQQKLIKDRPGQKPYLETLLPISTHNALLFEFGWNKDIQDAISRRDFRESFFGVVDWYFDYKNVFNYPARLEDFKSVQILDYFTKSSLKEGEQSLLEDYVHMYYGNISKQAIDKKDKKLKGIIISCINRLYLVAKIKNRAKNIFSESFFKKLRLIKQSLQLDLKGIKNF
ncbi:MAG: hypothetical protein HN576_12155 [Bacteriovoracaceae bacterium]|jgi:hypothetical protein|nr:hypothetical protein [Bacteriovoracaceae bacterium]